MFGSPYPAGMGSAAEAPSTEDAGGAEILRGTQTGYVRNYAATFLLGVVVVVSALLVVVATSTYRAGRWVGAAARMDTRLER